MEKLLPELAAVTLSSSSLRAAMHGNSIAAAASSEWIRLLDESGKLIALAQHEANECYHPVVVFPKESE